MINAIVQLVRSFHGFRSIPKTENQKLTLGVVKTSFSKRQTIKLTLFKNSLLE